MPFGMFTQNDLDEEVAKAKKPLEDEINKLRKELGKAEKDIELTEKDAERKIDALVQGARLEIQKLEEKHANQLANAKEMVTRYAKKEFDYPAKGAQPYVPNYTGFNGDDEKEGTVFTILFPYVSRNNREQTRNIKQQILGLRENLADEVGAKKLKLINGNKVKNGYLVKFEIIE